MCGFVAVFNFDNSLVDKAALVKAIECIKHRGPETSDIWYGGKNQNVALAHTRLSIIDLQGGLQPLRSNFATVVVNGEFYDYEKIRQEFCAEGFKFQSKTDSEIILPLFQKYGIHCLQYLRGEFAFSLFEKNSNSLFIARDRFGIKPLYYYKDAKRFIVASEIKSIFALGVVPEWNTNAIYSFISRYVLDPEETFFKGIYQVAPGHFMLISEREIQTRPYWNLDYNFDQPFTGSDEEAVAEFRSLFQESVRLRLVADVPVGVYLSGGLDSSSVFGMARQLSSLPPKAFTIKFKDALYDESLIATETAKLMGADIELVEVGENDLINNFEKALWHSEFCFTNTHGIAKYLLSKCVHNSGYKVVLTGEGSDELLGGYAHFRLDYLKENAINTQSYLQALESISQTNEISRGVIISKSQEKISHLENVLGFTPEFFLAPEGSYENVQSFFSTDFLQNKSTTDPFISMLTKLDLRPVLKADRMHKSMYMWTKTVFPNYLLNVLGDRMEMANSIEARLPFLDHKLVEFTQRINSDLKFKNDTDKYILRESMKDIISPRIYQRQKHPFLAPPASINTKGSLFNFYKDVLNSEDFRNLNIFNVNKVDKTLRSLTLLPNDERQALDSVLTSLVSFALLGKIFNVK